MKGFEPGVPCCGVIYDLTGPIRGAIINHQPAQRLSSLCRHALDSLRQVLLFVPDGTDDDVIGQTHSVARRFAISKAEGIKGPELETGVAPDNMSQEGAQGPLVPEGKKLRMADEHERERLAGVGMAGRATFQRAD
jgi:hypothetical protein